MEELKDKKILVVDDSQFMRKVLVDILKKNDFKNIIEVDNGEDAVEAYDLEKPDLVLLDLILPKMDGMDVLGNIIPKGAKVIVLSVVSTEDIINQVKDKGAQEYIVKATGHMKKPFDEEQVLAVMKDAFSK